MGFIKNIYEGEVSGIEQFGFNGSVEFRKLQDEKAKLIDKLENILFDDDKKSLESLIKVENKLYNIELKRMFEFAFRVGFNASLDIIDNNTDN